MTISEVSSKFGISQDTLRYYERAGLIANVNRDKSGIRNYSEEDCFHLEFVKQMRSAGLTIKTLRKYVGLLQQGNETITARRDFLIAQRRQLIKKQSDIQKALDLINRKITCGDGNSG